MDTELRWNRGRAGPRVGGARGYAHVEALEPRLFWHAAAFDPTFGGPDGCYWDRSDRHQIVRDVLPLPGGGALVAGMTHDGDRPVGIVFRLTPGGTLDQTFGAGGATLLPGFDEASRLALDGHGRIIIAGETWVDVGLNLDWPGPDVTVARLSADGAIDVSFGVGGQATVPLPLRDSVTGLLVQPDGRVVVLGWSADFRVSDYTDGLLLRLSADGAIDHSFGGGDGVVVIDRANTGRTSWDGTAAVGIQPGGRLIVATAEVWITDVPDADGMYNTFAGGAGLLGFTPTGEVDASFGVEGFAAVPLALGPKGIQATISGLDIDAAGRIVVAATERSAARTVVARFLPGGAVDPTFGTAGSVTIEDAGGGDGSDLARLIDGSYLLVTAGSGIAAVAVTDVGTIISSAETADPNTGWHAAAGATIEPVTGAVYAHGWGSPGEPNWWTVGGSHEPVLGLWVGRYLRFDPAGVGAPVAAPEPVSPAPIVEVAPLPSVVLVPSTPVTRQLVSTPRPAPADTPPVGQPHMIPLSADPAASPSVWSSLFAPADAEFMAAGDPGDLATPTYSGPSTRRRRAFAT